MWPSIRSWLPPAPASVVEIGCGSLGGFVPMLNADGYQAVGIDPAAPEGTAYRRIEFERTDLPARMDVAVASTSLHHVADPGAVLDKVAGGLEPGGLVIVVEWDWEAFDEDTARWCLERQPDPDGWLRRRLDAWAESGQPWERAFQGWAVGHGLHSAGSLIAELDQRFERYVNRRGPYLFTELVDTTESDEQRAIDAGQIPALRVDYVGRL
ncbi:MAG: class I SAM-dependent methyltransferase [Solirubrobacteraceae bacterium]